MRLIAIALIVLCCGCQTREVVTQAELAECFAEAAYAAVRARKAPPAPPSPEQCCSKCGKDGLPPGKVRSGDGLAIVSCPCPDTCKCKVPREQPRRTR